MTVIKREKNIFFAIISFVDVDLLLLRKKKKYNFVESEKKFLYFLCNKMHFMQLSYKKTTTMHTVVASVSNESQL